MPQLWKADFDATLQGTSEEEYKKLAEMALDYSQRLKKSKIKVALNGGIRVECFVSKNTIRIMECVAEFPFKKSL